MLTRADSGRSRTRCSLCSTRRMRRSPGTARDLCRQWVHAGWLVRHVSDDDVEVYRLSAYGVGALEVAGRVGGVWTRVSESRVRTLLDAIELLAQDADPDMMAVRAENYVRAGQEPLVCERWPSGMIAARAGLRLPRRHPCPRRAAATADDRPREGLEILACAAKSPARG